MKHNKSFSMHEDSKLDLIKGEYLSDIENQEL